MWFASLQTDSYIHLVSLFRHMFVRSAFLNCIYFYLFLGGEGGGSRCLLHCPTENSTYCWRGEGAKVSVLPGFPQLARSKSDSKTTDARSVRHFSLQFRSHKSSAEAAECVKVTQLVAAPRTRNYWGSAK